MSDSRSIFRRLDEFTIPFPLIVRLILGGMFIYMGLLKLDNPVEFLKQIRLYEALPEDPPYYLNGTAIVLPWLEVLCGVGLIIGLWIRGAALQLTIMLLVFTPAVFLRAMDIHNTEGTPFFAVKFDCGCGTGEVIIWQKLLGNVGLILLALFSLCSRSRRLTLASYLQRRYSESDGSA